MAADVYAGAFAALDRVRAETDAVLVAFSGGKESLCVLDMAVKVFARVLPLHLYFVPGLRCVEDTIDRARERYKLEVLYYPHPALVRALKDSDYCFSSWKNEDLTAVTFGTMYELPKAEAGIRHVLTGARRSDSRQRRILMDQGLFPGIHPLADWSKHHVLAYLARNNIPRPPAPKGATTNIGLEPRDLLWMAECYPEDFRRFGQWFPFAEAAIHRKRLYGYGG